MEDYLLERVLDEDTAIEYSELTKDEKLYILACVGIIACVDEATEYQNKRPDDELRQYVVNKISQCKANRNKSFVKVKSMIDCSGLSAEEWARKFSELRMGAQND